MSEQRPPICSSCDFFGAEVVFLTALEYVCACSVCSCLSAMRFFLVGQPFHRVGWLPLQLAHCFVVALHSVWVCPVLEHCEHVVLVFLQSFVMWSS